MLTTAYHCGHIPDFIIILYNKKEQIGSLEDDGLLDNIIVPSTLPHQQK